MASSSRASLTLLAILIGVYWLGGQFFAYQLILFLIYAIAAFGVGFLWSKAGILSLGQACFFGLGAYTTAFILKSVDATLAQAALILIACAVIGLLAYALAYLVFRGRPTTGPFFSLITLALAMLAEQVANSASSITGGFNGFGGYDNFMGLDPFTNFYWLVAASAVLVCFLYLWLSERPIGLLLAAIGDNEQRAQLLGFKTHSVKAFAFGLSAATAAFAGALFANYYGLVTPSSIGFLLSAELVIWVAVGGRFHPFGVLLGVCLVGLLSVNLRDQIEIWDIVLALIFAGVVLKAPRGLWGLLELLPLPALAPRARAEAVVELDAAPKLTQSNALTFQGVGLTIGNVRILHGVDFQTPDQGIVSIIGPNGAGKTSALNIISGNLAASQGAVLLRGEAIHNRPPFMALASGIGRKLQIPAVFMSLTIAQNLAIANMAGRLRLLDYGKKQPLAWRRCWQRSVAAMPCFHFLSQSNARADSLAQGHRQFLEFLMTTASEPRLLLLDEPGAGLSPDDTRAMIELIRLYQQRFAALVLVIEHDMDVVKNISDQVIVLHQGEVLATGSFAEVQNNAAVRRVYAGGSKN